MYGVSGILKLHKEEPGQAEFDNENDVIPTHQSFTVTLDKDDYAKDSGPETV